MVDAPGWCRTDFTGGKSKNGQSRELAIAGDPAGDGVGSHCTVLVGAAEVERAGRI